MNHRTWKSALMIALLVGTASPALARHDSSGVNLENDAGIKTLTSARTGHAKFTKAELAHARAAASPEVKKEFDAVYAKLSAYKASQDQLAALLVKNRLKQKDAMGHTVLDDLYLATTRPTAHGISATNLVADLVADICRPTTIAQAGHNTCTATSIQSALARSKPGEYARLVVGLGTGGGAVKMGGVTFSSADYIAFKDRSVSSNLVQPAIMEAEASTDHGHYRNKVDKTYPAHGKPYEGADHEGVSFVESHVLGGHYTFEDLEDNGSNKAKIVKIARRATPKSPMLVSVSLSDSGSHEVQCVGYDPNAHTYKIRNPWGQEHIMPAAKFEKAVTGVNYRVQ